MPVGADRHLVDIEAGQPDETKTVVMKLKAESLAYRDEKASRFVVEDEPCC